MKVLILDEDPTQGDLTVDYLNKNKVQACQALESSDFERRLKRDPPDVAVLGIHFQGKDSFQVLREVRKDNERLPVLLLTDRCELEDKVLGLQLGADDFLAKPFAPRELLARLQALARRNGPAPHSLTRHGNLLLDHGRRMAFLKGRDLELTVYAFDGLAALAAAAGRLVSRAQLMEQLKGLKHDSLDRCLDVMVSRLRRRLGDDPRRPFYIQTVYGEGYLFLKQADEPR